MRRLLFQNRGHSGRWLDTSDLGPINQRHRLIAAYEVAQHLRNLKKGFVDLNNLMFGKHSLGTDPRRMDPLVIQLPRAGRSASTARRWTLHLDTLYGLHSNPRDSDLARSHVLHRVKPKRKNGGDFVQNRGLRLLWLLKMLCQRRLSME